MRLRPRTRVIVLQHRREREVPINTARIAALSLEESELRVGVDFTTDAVVARAVADGAALLYPGEGAVIAATLVDAPPKHLLVVDGTWAQARSLLRHNPFLRALPRVTFSDRSLSRYRIRAEPRPEYVSTIEALSRVLGELEGDPERYAAMLAPFDQMVETQLEYVERMRGQGARHGRAKAKRARRAERPCIEVPPGRRLLAVHAEVNAWPRDRGPVPPAEVVHLVAHRLDTNERFDAIVRPRGALSPSTARHVRLAPEVILEAAPIEVVAERWRSFLTLDDWPVYWGGFPIRLARAAGVVVADDGLDLRGVLRREAGAGWGGVEGFATQLGLPVDDEPSQSRAQVRLQALVSMAGHLRQATVHAIRDSLRELR